MLFLNDKEFSEWVSGKILREEQRFLRVVCSVESNRTTQLQTYSRMESGLRSLRDRAMSSEIGSRKDSKPIPAIVVEVINQQVEESLEWAKACLTDQHLAKVRARLQLATSPFKPVRVVGVAG